MATAITPQSESEILNEVITWPAPKRLSLASKIIQSLELEQQGSLPVTEKSSGAPQKSGSIEDLIGVWADVTPKPTDDDVKRIIEEERLRKFGA